MCIICGDVEIIDTKHLEDVIKSLNEQELAQIIASVKKQLSNASFLGFSEDVYKHLRKVLLVSLVELVKRK